MEITRRPATFQAPGPGAQHASALLAQIGNTPLLELDRTLDPQSGTKLYAKWEGANPSGSLKDRIVKRIVDDALADGRLVPGMTVVEASSGNTGIAMGLIGALYGIPMRVYMPESKSIERRKLMRFWGVDLRLTSGADPNSHIRAAEELVRENPDEFFYLNQNGSAGNAAAHADGTAAEIWEQTGGNVDTVIAALGTSGTLMGLALWLKARHPAIEIVGVQPEQAQSKIEGLLYVSPEYVPPIYNDGQIDRTLHISDALAIEETRLLARREGLFAGISSGACVAAARSLAQESPGRRIVVVLGDRGDRYLSTALFAGVET
jgi:cysteine synthase